MFILFKITCFHLYETWLINNNIYYTNDGCHYVSKLDDDYLALFKLTFGNVGWRTEIYENLIIVDN